MSLLLLVVLGGFGLMIGSFLNVCIARLPAGESIVTPPSRCPKCRALIQWHDNIPVVSYLILKGRCRRCGERISPVYPAVELITALCFVAQGAAVGTDWLVLGQRLLFTAMLIVLFGTDLATMRLPNAITYPGILVGIAFSFFMPPGPVASLIGVAIGAGIPWLIRWIWFRLRGIEAMGLGDVKMLAMIGAFLGWQQVWVVLFFASLAGAVVGIIALRLRGQSLGSRLPFGTFLAVAAFIASLIGERLIDWYLGFYEF